MAVVILRDPISGKSFSGVEGKKMYIYAESTGTLALSAPYAPREIEYGGWAQDWTQTDRSGNTPLLLRKGQPLLSLRFTLMLADTNPFASQADNLLALYHLARTKERVLVRYSQMESGLWRVTDLSVSSQHRHPETNEITRATVSLTLTQASDAAPSVGPVSGGPPPTPAPANPAPRTHTVVRGDTLWGIAQRYYGNGTLWPRIFDANRSKIADPHWIFPAQVFVIP